jgi:hypothetical protein
MYCENCDYDIEIASNWFYNDYQTELLLSFGYKIHRDVILYISKYLMYKDHCIFITDKQKMYNGKLNRLICTGCFQKGLYKYSYSGNNIIQTPTISNDIQYFYNYIQKDDRTRLLQKYKTYFFPRDYYLHYNRKNPIVTKYTYITEL